MAIFENTDGKPVVVSTTPKSGPDNLAHIGKSVQHVDAVSEGLPNPLPTIREAGKKASIDQNSR